MSTVRIKSIKRKTISLGELWDTLPAVNVEREGDDKEWREFTEPLSVQTPDGPAKATHAYKTRDFPYRIELESGTILRSGADHRYYLASAQRWGFVRDLCIGDALMNFNGAPDLICSIEREAEEIDLYDIQVPGPECYFANGIMSHNSLIANQLAKNQALLGYKVHFVPLEMTEREMIGRTISNISGIDNTKVQLRRMATGEKELAWKQWRRFERRVEKAGGRLTIFKPQADMRIEEIANALHSMPSDVVYIDYVGLLKGTDGDDQWRQLGNIARYGKIHADLTGKAVVLLCQVSEDGVVRYSRTMAEHAATSFIFTATRETKEQGFLNIHMTKARNQRQIDFYLKVDYATQKAMDMSPEEMDAMSAAASTEGSRDARKRKNQRRRRGEGEESNDTGTGARKRRSRSDDDSESYMPDLTGDSV